MTTINLSRKAQAQGDGIVTGFSYPFPTALATDLTVYKVTRATQVLNTALTLGVDYTVAISDIVEGGVVTYTVAPTTLEDSLITRVTGRAQGTAYPNVDEFDEAAVEANVDQAARINIEQDEAAGRTLTIPITSTKTVAMDEPVDGTVPRWSDANATYEHVEITGAGTYVDPITAEGDLIQGGATGDAEKITVGTVGQMIKSDGTKWVKGTADTANITDGAVTTAKILDKNVTFPKLADASKLLHTGDSTGAANIYALTTGFGLASLVKGMTFSFKSHQDNAGASTINVDALGGISVVGKNGAALNACDIESGDTVLVIYDGGTFQLFNTSPGARFPDYTAGDTELFSVLDTVTHIGDTSEITMHDSIIGRAGGLRITFTFNSLSPGPQTTIRTRVDGVQKSLHADASTTPQNISVDITGLVKGSHLTVTMQNNNAGFGGTFTAFRVKAAEETIQNYIVRTSIGAI